MNPKDRTGTDATLEALPESLREFLVSASRKASFSQGFYNGVVAGDCPKCGSFNTLDGGDTPLNDPTLGICLDCFTITCMECGQVFRKGQTLCDHWRICEKCDSRKEDKSCRIPTWECPMIQAWKKDRKEFGP